jgi:hypothetical protein
MSSSKPKRHLASKARSKGYRLNALSYQTRYKRPTIYTKTLQKRPVMPGKHFQNIEPILPHLNTA